MRADIENFKTGWYGITIGMKTQQIDCLIAALEKMKSTQSHFHLRSDFEGSGGVGDIEFCWMPDKTIDNMDLDDSPVVPPNR